MCTADACYVMRGLHWQMVNVLIKDTRWSSKVDRVADTTLFKLTIL